MGMAPLDYGPVLLRKPFGSRLAADTLPSGCPDGQNSTVGASPWLCPSFPTSCPCRVRHGRAPQPTRHYPRLWIHRPSSGRPRDLNPPDRDAAQHTICPPPTPDRGGPRLWIPAPRGSDAMPRCPTTRPGLSGSSIDLSAPAVPYHPGEPDRCICSLLRGRCQASPSLGGWPLP